MKIKSEELILDLTERTRKNIFEAEELQLKNEEDLNWRPDELKWSALECLEHLNLYGDYYLEEIERAIRASKHPSDPEFKSGIMGNYFAKMMLPGEKTKKMKTFKDKNPIGKKLDKSTITRFIRQQQKLLELLARATKVSLTNTKTGTSISSYIQLKLGDTFRVIIYHNQRHIEQAKKVLEAKQGSK